MKNNNKEEKINSSNFLCMHAYTCPLKQSAYSGLFICTYLNAICENCLIEFHNKSFM